MIRIIELLVQLQRIIDVYALQASSVEVLGIHIIHVSAILHLATTVKPSNTNVHVRETEFSVNPAAVVMPAEQGSISAHAQKIHLDAYQNVILVSVDCNGTTRGKECAEQCQQVNMTVPVATKD